LITRGSAIKHAGKIMVRAPNWIGDAVMSLPALEALERHHASAEIVLVAKPWVSELFSNHPAVNRVIVYDSEGEHKGARGLGRLVRALRRERFDAAILFQNAFHAAWMAWLAGIPQRIGYARDGRRVLLTEAVEVPAAAAYGHHTYYYLQLLFRAGVIPKPEPVEEVRLTVEKAEKAWARKHVESLGLHGPRFLVGLSPGASFGPAKRWPVERYADLADRLIGALNADVLIFGSAAEKPLAEAIAGAMEHTPTIVAGQTTLRQLMALLAQCRLIVTNDSGPMHLAAALGVPLVAIFGSTDERATGPLGPEVRVVKQPVACSPCGLRECPIDFRCMTGVSVESVHRAALEVVKETRD
jgi:lipopolysaccharide heptosyltransferase II